MKKLLLIFCLVPLAACHVRQDFHEPTSLTEQKLSLHAATANVQAATKDVDAAWVQKITADYQENGRDAVEITVTYDPDTRRAAALAAKESARIAALFRSHGVFNLAVDTLPAAAPEVESQTLISYQTVKAEIPAGCHNMGGVGGQPTAAPTPDYQIGCTIESQLAGQIARPQDLAGRGGLDAGSGRRAANVADGYQHGVPNPALQNTQSSTASTSQ